MEFRWGDAFQGPEHRTTRLAGPRGTVVLVHGFPGTPHEMRGLASALHAAGWGVVAPLLPGFGPELDRVAEYGRADWVEAVRRPLAEAVGPRLLVGFSMGAAIALEAARDVPPDACALVAPLTRLETGLWGALWPVLRLAPAIPVFKLFPPDWSDAGLKAEIARYMPGFDLEDPQVQQAIERYAMPTRLIDQVLTLGREAESHASALRCPTLVVQGLDDPLVRPHRTRALLPAIGGPLRYAETPGDHAIVRPEARGHGVLRDELAAFAARVGV